MVCAHVPGNVSGKTCWEFKENLHTCLLFALEETTVVGAGRVGGNPGQLLLNVALAVVSQVAVIFSSG